MMIDPLAETQSDFTPYHFGYNSPISLNDPSGLTPEDSKASEESEYEKSKRNYDNKDGGPRPIATCETCPKTAAFDKYRNSSENYHYHNGVVSNLMADAIVTGSIAVLHQTSSDNNIGSFSEPYVFNFGQRLVNNIRAGDRQAIDLMNAYDSSITFNILFQRNRDNSAKWFVPFGLTIVTGPLGLLGGNAGLTSTLTTPLIRGSALRAAGLNTLAKYWPGNGGALGSWSTRYLMPGTYIDRFGSGFGRYFSPRGTPMDMRALRATNTAAYNMYRVVQPFHVQSSTIAPAFEKLGLGTQYLAPVSANTLLKRGIIELVK